MPKVEDIFSKLIGARYFSTLDLWAGYHYIPLEKSSIPKTAFNSPFGKYEYVKVPFHLAQAPANFQELMTGTLKEFDFAITYLNDIIIWSRMLEEHLSHIKQAFEKLRNANLSMKFSKCHFFTKEIQYLGDILSTKGIRPLPSKTQAIKTMHLPKMPKGVHAFLVLLEYYRKFIKNFAKIAKPFNTSNTAASEVWSETNPSWSLSDTKKIHYWSTHTTLPRSQQEVYSLYRCIRWHLWSAAIPGTWWHWIPYCLPFAYLFGNTKKMEHHWAGSLRSTLCHYQMILLSPGSWYHSAKWP